MTDGNVNRIHYAHEDQVGKILQDKKNQNTEAAQAFVAAFKEAEKVASQVAAADKKHKDELARKKEIKTKKQDFEWDDEIDFILSEIDKKLEELKKLGEDQENK
jgi:hypothetical protein